MDKNFKFYMSSPTVYEDAVLLPYYEGDFHREEEFGLPEDFDPSQFSELHEPTPDPEPEPEPEPVPSEHSPNTGGGSGAPALALTAAISLIAAVSAIKRRKTE